MSDIYLDQTLTVAYPRTLAREAMLEVFIEFLPGLTLRALSEDPTWPGVLAALEYVDEPDLWRSSAELASWARPERSLVGLGLWAMSSLALRADPV